MQEEKIKSKVDVSTILLISFVVITFITNISIASIQGFVDEWFKVPTVIGILTGFQIIRNVSYVLPALAIKNKTYKIIGVILSSIAIIYSLCSPIMTMLRQG